MLSNPKDVAHICQVLDQDIPLAQSFETIDHVYTITSQAGFEALMRGIKVTTLGCPFYSGWGLTDDRQPNERRARKLTIEELVAVVYFEYLKYFDPIYRKPLTAEEAIDRLVQLKALKQLEEEKNSLDIEPNNISNILPVESAWAIGFNIQKEHSYLKSVFSEYNFKFISENISVVEFFDKWVKVFNNTQSKKVFLNEESSIDDSIREFFIENKFEILSFSYSPLQKVCDENQYSCFILDKNYSFNSFKHISKVEQDCLSYNFSNDPLNLIGSAKECMESIFLNWDKSKPDFIEGIDDYTLLIWDENENPKGFTLKEALYLLREDESIKKIVVVIDHLIDDMPDIEDENILLFNMVNVDVSRLLYSAKKVVTVSSFYGFMALILGIPVRTFGYPFYAGWGLTTDAVYFPERRDRKLSITELFGVICKNSVIVDHLQKENIGIDVVLNNM